MLRITKDLGTCGTLKSRIKCNKKIFKEELYVWSMFVYFFETLFSLNDLMDLCLGGVVTFVLIVEGYRGFENCKN